jgi:septum formation protein
MLILASASPRRAELLRNAGIGFAVDPAHVPEQPLPNEAPLDYARRLAHDKAQTVFARRPNDAVLGADTIVLVDEHLLEKPVDASDASRMLRLLSARAHQVITAVCLIAPGFAQTEAEVTQVTFSELSDKEIAAYIQTAEPMDKAGAYGIQGFASRWVTSIAGDYFNVVGLPVTRVYGLLRRLEATTGMRLL